MIQFSGGSKDGKRRYIGIGLSAENLRRLQDGQPITIDLTTHEIPDAEVIVFYGRTEAEMEAMVKKNFIVGKPQ